MPDESDLLDCVQELDREIADFLREVVRWWKEGPNKDKELPAFQRYGTRLGELLAGLDDLYVVVHDIRCIKLFGAVKERLLDLANLFRNLEGLLPYAVAALQPRRELQRINREEQWWLVVPFELAERLRDQIDQAKTWIDDTGQL